MSSSNSTSTGTIKVESTTTLNPSNPTTASLPNTSTDTIPTAAAPESTSSTDLPTSLSSSSVITTPTSATSTTTTTTPPPPQSTTSSTAAPTSTSAKSTSPPTTASSTAPPTSASTTSTPFIPSSSTFTTAFTTTSDGSTHVVTVTSTTVYTSPSGTDSNPSTTSSGSNILQSDSSVPGGLNSQGKIAVAVVVPIAGIALLVVAGIFFWRKRKQRKDAEEERRKEVEDYIYNPNADPTLPDVGSAGGAAGAYEMKEDASSGYRGWGSTTLAGSTGRKASTTMSGGATGVAYSDGTSHTRGNLSDTRSGEALLSDGSPSPEGEILGAMGPSAADNRGGNVHRGPSNASSSYSAAARSDGSGENIGVAYGGPAVYYDQYGNNPYEPNNQQRPNESGGQPVIRDNPARRNTRIENPSHYPQQSAGISQNF